MASRIVDDGPPPQRSRSLSVVVVAHNNAATLPATIERLHRALVVTTEESEIIVFDDGSTDDTEAAIAGLAGRVSTMRVIRFEGQRGAGHCFTAGVREAKCSFVVYVPADNTWPYRSYIELFGNIGKADVITSYANNLFANLPPVRRWASRVYKVLLDAVFGLRLHYYNGLTIYPLAFLKSVRLESSGLGFQAEALIRAIGAGYSFVETALPIDQTTAVNARPLTPRNIFDAMAMIVRVGVQTRLASSAIGRRPAATNPVQRSQTVDELGLRIEPSATAGAGGALNEVPKGLRIAITGASSGIGRALAQAFYKDHRLFICARRMDRLSQIAALDSSIRAVTCDVTNEQQVANFRALIEAEAGGLDVLINCAGTFGEIGDLASTNTAKWWDTLRVNLLGPYLTIKHCLPLLERGRKPRIVNLAGGGAFSPFPNYSAYACSKAALVRLTECLAAELQPMRIRVNAISPGIVATEIHKTTLAAGEARAGRLQYRRTLAILEEGGPPVDNLINCVRAMLTPGFDHLTGKTISSNFDPWQTVDFSAHIDDIATSDLYTMRRIDLANLTDGYLRKTLSEAWANFGSGS